VITNHQRYRQTDRRTDGRHAIPRPRKCTKVHCAVKTSNALVTLVKTKQDCLKKLLKTVRTTRRISEIVRQRVPYRRNSDRKRPTAVCVESTAGYDELVSVCGTQTKPRSNVRGCDEMVVEVPRCLTVKTAVHHDTQLVIDPLWHIQPMKLIVQE